MGDPESDPRHPAGYENGPSTTRRCLDAGTGAVEVAVCGPTTRARNVLPGDVRPDGEFLEADRLDRPADLDGEGQFFAIRGTTKDERWSRS